MLKVHSEIEGNPSKQGKSKLMKRRCTGKGSHSSPLFLTFRKWHTYFQKVWGRWGKRADFLQLTVRKIHDSVPNDTHGETQLVPEIATIFLKLSFLFCYNTTSTDISASASLIVHVPKGQFLLSEVVIFYKITTNTEFINTKPLLPENLQSYIPMSLLSNFQQPINTKYCWFINGKLMAKQHHNLCLNEVYFMYITFSLRNITGFFCLGKLDSTSDDNSWRPF